MQLEERFERDINEANINNRQTADRFDKEIADAKERIVHLDQATTAAVINEHTMRAAEGEGEN